MRNDVESGSSTSDSGTAASEDAEEDYGALLHDAASVGDLEGVELLLAHGADANFVGVQGATALHAAAWNGHVDTLSLLLRSGARVGAAEERGCTVLHVAAQAGHEGAVRLLLQHSADLAARCALGTTPLELARENGHAATALLLQHTEPHAAAALLAPELDDGEALAAVPDAFAAQARAMPPPLRRLLVHNAPPASVSAAAVLHALRLPIVQFRAAAISLAAPADDVMLTLPALLCSTACSALRDAVDAAASAKPDSVDGLSDHQLDWRSLDALADVVGMDGVEALRALPVAFASTDARRAALGVAPEALRISQVFVRRYALGTRPWFTFHRDKGPLTVNVALASDTGHEGGRLLALVDGEVRAVERAEGEALIHPASLLHGVSSMRGGARYSLIVFFRTGVGGAAGVAAGERDADTEASSAIAER